MNVASIPSLQLSPSFSRLLHRAFLGRSFLLLLAGLAVAGLAACQGPAHPAAGNSAPPGTTLSPPLRQLLYPLPGPDSAAARADILRLQQARPRWADDSLGQLLVYSRLAIDFDRLQRYGAAQRQRNLGWRAACPRQRRRHPVFVGSLALALGHYYYGRASYDSARTYYQHAIATFQAGGLDSTRAVPAGLVLPTTDLWQQGKTLAGALASRGLASRHLGNLAEALRYYERAAALYQQQHDLPGLGWTQELMGEAQAEQGNLPEAGRAYEQALRTLRTCTRPGPGECRGALINLVLDYYAPLLLPDPRQRAYASQLAAEGARGLLAVQTSGATVPASDQLLLASLRLIPAEVALRNGQPAGATRWLAEADHRLRRAAAARDDATSAAADHAPVQAMAWGLRAWQQHAASPARSRRLLDQATALLDGMRGYRAQARWRQQLATYCLAMGEPAQAARLLRPLVPLFQQQRSLLPLSQVTELLTQSYAAAGRYDSAYRYARRTRALTDTVRAARQFAALASTEARFRTREQASQIRLLTGQKSQQALRTQVAAGGAVLFGLALLATALAWRRSRHLNRRLAAQGTLLHTQAERLASLDAAKNQFFANVSHELRTPLTLILGPLEGLLIAPVRPLPAATRQPVALAYRHAQRLRELVNRILDLTRLQAGRLALHPAPAALAALLHRVVTQFEALAAQRGVELRGPADLPESLCLLVDADKIEQVLTNLLINALNHTPAGGTVAVEVGLPAPGGQWEVRVRDTGPGIAEAEQARLFERYYQSPQSQAQGGTGLGLALSHELAALLGGTLTLESTLGQGATFTLRFPAPVLPAETPATVSDEVDAAATHSEETARTPPAPPGFRPRVLVVEDQPDLRDYLHQLLAPDYDVLTAPDGQAALDLLAREAPVDLVATDAMMPRLSGTELLTCLRADPTLASVPVLMLTARADEAHRLHALTLGVDDYLTKPFVASELLTRLRVLLARQQVRRHFATQPPELAEAAVTEAADSSFTPAMQLPGGEPAPTSDSAPVVLSPSPGTQLAQWQARVEAQLANAHFGPVELAELLHLSERTLYRRLGELVGLTPAAWLRELRLNQARRLFEAGDLKSVAAVASAVGIPNHKHFAKLYAERFGCRPSSYHR